MAVVCVAVVAVAGCFFNPTGTVPDPEPTETGTTETSMVPTTDGPAACNNNGTCEAGEDAANCPSDCAGCGDGIVVVPEVCDDGNANGAYGQCNNSCTDIVRCGDGIVQIDHEVCDDGTNDGGYGGCATDCQALGPYCGDGECQAPHESATNCPQDGCLATCGNGILEPGEVCDDGVDGMPTDSANCNADCSKPECGDGYVNEAAGEQCDDGNDNNNDACVMCQDAVCGDGIVWTDVEDCDDGNDVNVDDCSNHCELPRVVFVTSMQLQGDLGGLGQADEVCQNLADKVGLDGNFKAWLSDLTGSPATRFDTGFTGIYRRRDGVTIAVGWTDLTDGTLSAPINRDEMLAYVASGGVWTHTEPDGTASAGNPCDGWSSASSADSAVRGSLISEDKNWTNVGNELCDTTFRLYCFEDP